MISVIVPIYNVERFLPSTIGSLLDQVGNVDFEILLIDDGSTDTSADICDKYSRGNNNISVIHKANGGLSSARNAGIDAARGDYLMFLDGDDCLDPVTLSSLAEAISLHPDCDIFQFRYEEVSLTIPLGHCCSRELNDYYECKTEYDFFLQLQKLGGVAASACTKLIKRNVIGALRFKEGILHEDEEFVTRILPKCRTIGYCSNDFYKYLMRPGSIINSCFSKKRLDIVPIMKERIEYLDGKNYVDLSEMFRSQLYRNLCRFWNEAYISRDRESLCVIEKHLSEMSDARMNLTGQYWLILNSGICRHTTLQVLHLLKSFCKPLVQKLRNAKIKFARYSECRKRRKRLKCKDFTIISNNCWGGIVYQYFGIQYSTPTIGLFMMDDDYIKFLENLDYYLAQPLYFIPHLESKYNEQLSLETTAKDNYPIALLDDIEVHFLHYESSEEAQRKWDYRKKRINKERLLIKMSQRSSSDLDILERFKKLSFNNKICFTEVEFEGKEFIYIPELKRLNIQGGDETPYVMEAINIIDIVNSIQ